MFSAMDFVIKFAVEAAILISILYLYLHHNNAGEKSGKLLFYSIAAAIPAGVIFGYLENSFFNREIMDLIWRTVSIIIALIILLVLRLEKLKINNISVCMTGFFIALIPFTEVSHFFISMIIRNKGFMNTDYLIKGAGGAAAVIIAFFLFRYISILGIKASYKSMRIWGGFILALYLVRESIGLLHMFFLLGFIRPSKFSVSIIAPFINSWQPVFYYLFIFITISWIIWIAYKLPRTISEETKNPAEIRKEYSRILLNIRQLITAAFLIILVFITSGLNFYFGQNKVKLSPAVKVNAKDGYVNILKQELEDGKMHRYGYMTRNNIEVRFIVIKKGDNVYGVGLDACKICGSVGYYQKKDQIICLNCDVVMNIPTIGFPGGCNPIPLEYKTDDNVLSIKESILENSENEFKF